MTDRSTLCRELQSTWHRDIPLAAAMAIEVASYDGRSLTVRAPLAPNRNLHGTAFAGGLFSVCVLTGWGAVWLGLKERDAGGLIVVAGAISIEEPWLATSSAAAARTPRRWPRARRSSPHRAVRAYRSCARSTSMANVP
jgi:thioesterase domain-containing protein